MEDVIALPPSDCVVGVPEQRVQEEDIQQILCICEVTEAIARRALLRCGNNLEQAITLILECPECLLTPTGASTQSVGVSFETTQLTDTKTVEIQTSETQCDPCDVETGPLDVVAESSQVSHNDGTGMVDVHAGQTTVGDTVMTDLSIVPVVASSSQSAEASLQGELMDSIARADVIGIKHAVAAGANVCAVDAAGTPAVHLVLLDAISGHVLNKHVSTIQLLLDARADVQAVDKLGRNLGHRLAEFGANKVLGELCKEGLLALEARDTSGQTLLHKSALGGHPKTTALLLQLGAKQDVTDLQNKSPAAIAASNGADNVLDELLERPYLVHLVHRVVRERGAGDKTPCDALSATHRGNMFMKAGNYPCAIEQYTLSINSADELEAGVAAEAYYNRACVHVELRNYENVVEDTTHCLRYDPGHGSALVRRAQAYIQLEKLKAAYTDILAAQHCDLSLSYKKIAHAVHRDVKSLLQADGVDISMLNFTVAPPVISTGVKNSPPSPYQLLGQPSILAMPRTWAITGRELYSVAWHYATCGAEPPSEWTFELRIVEWFAEDHGVHIPCDESIVGLRQECTVAMEWEAPPDEVGERITHEHASVQEVHAEESKKVTLSSCFDALVERRTLGEEDAWYCPTCKESQQATTETLIESLPPVLILQLKRFYYTHKRRGKIHAEVEFPMQQLDLSRWCRDTQQSSVFDLFGVVNHTGGLSSGHYTAYAKPSSDLQGWHYFNDSHFKPMSEVELSTPNAYILFYAKRGS